MLKENKIKTQDCPTCEQPYTTEENTCPHCHNAFVVVLDLGPTEWKQQVSKLKDILENDENDQDARQELSQLLYFEAMKLRYENSAESLSLLEEVVNVMPDHWEARLKVSWLSIRFTKNERAIEVLLPVVESSETTDLQKQRAYTNLSCAENWKEKDPDFTKAVQWARAGIALDCEGTAKLWENLATALKNQQRLEEARVAFKHAIKLNPKSVNAIERQASIDRHLKIQKRQEADGKGKKFRLKSPRDLLGKKTASKDFVKL